MADFIHDLDFGRAMAPIRGMRGPIQSEGVGSRAPERRECPVPPVERPRAL